MTVLLLEIPLFVYMQIQSGFSVFGQGITLLIIMKCKGIVKYKEIGAIPLFYPSFKNEKNKINILVGTQLISKGFNFPNLNCIVVVDADFSGMGFDLRSNEKNINFLNPYFAFLWSCKCGSIC